MRVIGGTARGHRLLAPKGTHARPTADRVKESLFDILGDRVAGARVLDLYAGSGALGIEALSRGATGAVFVDRTRASIEAVRRNLETTKLASLGEVRQSGAIEALTRLAGAKESFDLIFLDPPYTIDLAELAATFALLGAVCRTHGVVVLEHRSDLPHFDSAAFAAIDRRRYGDTGLTFFEKI